MVKEYKMKDLANRLTRKDFKCEIETQGKDEIVRCNWKNVIEDDTGKIFTASIIPKTMSYGEILDINIMAGTGRALPTQYNNKLYTNGINTINKQINLKGEYSKFNGYEIIKAEMKPNGNYPANVIARIMKPNAITDEWMDNVSNFVNDIVGKLRTK